MMQTIPWTARAVTVARKATGFALVLTALAGSAQAGACPPVPEIDPGSILSALTLLSGGLLMLTERRSRPV